jgi:hypothetical protein
MGRLLINDENINQEFDLFVGQCGGHATGCVPRDWERMPYGCPGMMGVQAFPLPLFTDQEILDRIADQARHKSSLYHIRMDHKIRSLDQNGYPLCWGYSTTKAVMLGYAAQNQPMIELSGTGLALLASNWQVRGGWCQESLETAVQVGVPSAAVWDPKITRQNQLDMNAVQVDASKRKVTEFFDIGDCKNASNLRALVTALLLNMACMVEYNRLAHSMCGVAVLGWNPLKLLIDNSWGETWDEDGMVEYTGNAAIPDNSACPAVITAS